jgi:SAM-dependent methyltransferase
LFSEDSLMDTLAQFKQVQKETWATFAPLEAFTTPAAGRLVRRAGVAEGMRVLDVGCGTGVVAITAARRGALVSAIDLTPQLLERARENSAIAAFQVEWREGDAEALPFEDAHFDVVLSQFAHMFAPRPEVATREMVRVLKPGGTLAFSTWPPELLVGRTMALAGRYMPPPPPGIPSPLLWGDPNIVRERLGNAVRDIVFDRATMFVGALSLQHFRGNIERAAGPVTKLVASLSAQDPDRLRAYRAEFDAIVADYFEDNVVRQDYLLTSARKV